MLLCSPSSSLEAMDNAKEAEGGLDSESRFLSDDLGQGGQCQCLSFHTWASLVGLMMFVYFPMGPIQKTQLRPKPKPDLYIESFTGLFLLSMVLHPIDTGFNIFL